MRTFLGLLAAVTLVSAGPAGAAALKGECPDGYVVKPGLNTDFPFEGMKRAFVVYPPEGGGKAPAPLWVPLTGSTRRPSV